MDVTDAKAWDFNTTKVYYKLACDSGRDTVREVAFVVRSPSSSSALPLTLTPSEPRRLQPRNFSLHEEVRKEPGLRLLGQRPDDRRARRQERHRSLPVLQLQHPPVHLRGALRKSTVTVPWRRLCPYVRCRRDSIARSSSPVSRSTTACSELLLTHCFDVRQALVYPLFTRRNKPFVANAPCCFGTTHHGWLL